MRQFTILTFEQLRNIIPSIAAAIPPETKIGINHLPLLFSQAEKYKGLKGYRFYTLLQVNASAIFVFKKKTFFERILTW